MVIFDATKKDMRVIQAICARGFETAAAMYATVTDMQMDIVATHRNGCPLDLSKLLAADDFNFYHDIFGIAKHLSRETGELKDCFLPRCAKPQH